MPDKKIYFASDVHLGLSAESRTHNHKREQVFSRWLAEVAPNAEAIYILGDLFDFWFEYKYVVPKGFTRVLGKLAELADAGIPIHIFPGNHDLWMFGYLEDELGVTVHRSQPYEVVLHGKRFVMAHGDGLGAGDRGYKMLRSIFACRFLQRLFSMIHPRWALGLAQRWSRHSRLSKGVAVPFRGEEESLYRYTQEVLKDRPVDFFIFGHRHTPIQMELQNDSQLIILGEWIKGCMYGVFDGEKMELRKFE